MFVWLTSIAIIVILASPAGLLIGPSSGITGGRQAFASSSGTIYRTASGLVASDSLTTGNSSGWGFNGSAVPLNAPRLGSEDSNGMHIGVTAPSTGTWAGYFAITPLL